MRAGRTVSTEEPYLYFRDCPSDRSRFQLHQLEKLVANVMNLARKRLPFLNLLLHKNKRRPHIILSGRNQSYGLRTGTKRQISKPFSNFLSRNVTPHFALLLLHVLDGFLKPLDSLSEALHCLARTVDRVSGKGFERPTNDFTSSRNPLNDDFFTVEARCPNTKAIKKVVIVLLHELIELIFNWPQRFVGGEKGERAGQKRRHCTGYRACKAEPLFGRRRPVSSPNRASDAQPCDNRPNEHETHRTHNSCISVKSHAATLPRIPILVERAAA